MGNKSTVMRVRSDTLSVRSTIPEGIVSDLGLQVGDVLDWSIVEEKGKKYARFRKLE